MITPKHDDGVLVLAQALEFIQQLADLRVHVFDSIQVPRVILPHFRQVGQIRRQFHFLGFHTPRLGGGFIEERTLVRDRRVKNRKERFARNFVRIRVLPVLERRFPGVEITGTFRDDYGRGSLCGFEKEYLPDPERAKKYDALFLKYKELGNFIEKSKL